MYYVFKLPDDHPEFPGRYEWDIKDGPSARQGGTIAAGPFKICGYANDKAIELQWCQNLTDRQKLALTTLWFEFGNHGPQHSMNDHKFIQAILETGRYCRTFYQPTPLCEDCVINILNPEWFKNGLKRMANRT